MPLPLPASQGLPAERSTFRNVVVWSALIAGVVGLFQFQDVIFDTSSVIPRWSFVAVAVLAFVAWGAWRIFRAMRLNNRAVALMGTGAYAEAERVLLEAVRCGDPRVASLFLYNLGIAAIQQGQLERAERYLAASERARKMGTAHFVRNNLPNLIAFCFALRTQLTEAKQWLEEDTRRRGSEPSNFRLLAESVYLARNGELAAVAQRMETSQREIAAQGGLVRKLHFVVWAFALDATQAPREKVQNVLASLRPSVPGELHFLVSFWPELHAFVKREGLAGQPRAA